MLRNLEVNQTVQASWSQHFLTLTTEPLPHTPHWGDRLGNIGPDGCKIPSEVMLLWPRESVFLCGKEQVWRGYVFRSWLMGERSSPPHEGAVWLMIGWTGVQSVLSSISQQPWTISVLERGKYLQTFSPLYPSRYRRQLFRGTLSRSWGILNFGAPLSIIPICVRVESGWEL